MGYSPWFNPLVPGKISRESLTGRVLRVLSNESLAGKVLLSKDSLADRVLTRTAIERENQHAVTQITKKSDSFRVSVTRRATQNDNQMLKCQL